jgi:alpha-tubulin suppressor-like RCC1 family protein
MNRAPDRRRYAATLAWTLVLVTSGTAPHACRSPTQIKVPMSLDFACDKHVGSAITTGVLDAIETRPPTGASTQCDPATRSLGDVVLVPSGDAHGDVAIKVVVGVGRPADRCAPPAYEGCIVARRALKYVEGATLTLPIVMHESCVDVPCSPTETCVEGGRCVSAVVRDPSRCAQASGCGEDQLGAPADPDGGVPDADAGPGVDAPTPIAAGYKHTCVAKNGNVSCFGDNGTGQLGRDPSIVPFSAAPLLISAAGGAIALATRESTTCARRAGDIVCWGRSDRHQRDVTTESREPAPIAAFGAAASIAPGYLHTCWIAAGDAACWGEAPGGTPGATLDSGAISSTVRSAGLTNVVEVASGEAFACARTSAGKVHCWGQNDDMQANAESTTSPIVNPVPIELGTSQPAEQIGAGAYFACARIADGTVRCWGNNEFEQLGRLTNPGNRAGVGVVQTATGAALSGVRRIAVGNSFACATLTNGELHCWGHNEFGQLGRDDPGGPRTSPTPQAVTSLTDVEHAAAGAFHACAITRSGVVKCWGQGNDGQIGRLQDSRVPVEVTVP